MAKPKRKLTAAERAERKRRKKEFMTIFVNGRQKRVRREPTCGGLTVENFILQNADPIFLHQEERWDILDSRAREEAENAEISPGHPPSKAPRPLPGPDDDNELPF